MDPDETLARIRAALTEIRTTSGGPDADRDASDAAVGDLITHVEALDDWMSRAGFLPAAWAVTTYDADALPGEQP